MGGERDRNEALSRYGDTEILVSVLAKSKTDVCVGLCDGQQRAGATPGGDRFIAPTLHTRSLLAAALKHKAASQRVRLLAVIANKVRNQGRWVLVHPPTAKEYYNEEINIDIFIFPVFCGLFGGGSRLLPDEQYSFRFELHVQHVEHRPSAALIGEHHNFCFRWWWSSGWRFCGHDR